VARAFVSGALRGIGGIASFLVVLRYLRAWCLIHPTTGLFEDPCLVTIWLKLEWSFAYVIAGLPCLVFIVWWRGDLADFVDQQVCCVNH
jgi:hypothetical protein